MREAREFFAPMAADAAAMQPFDKAAFRRLRDDHRETQIDVIDRVRELTDDGDAEAARALLEEWNAQVKRLREQASGVSAPLP